jgi:tetratricopeptide (TPR) repeat protein
MQKLVEGYFQLKSLGPTRVKGVSEPVAVFEVTGLGPLRTRLQVAARRGLTRFVGRQAEIETMKRAAELAGGGHGQIVAAMAEAGVGKSRLFFEFKAGAQSGWMVLEAFSVSHGKASAYLPVIELLCGYFQLSVDDSPRIRREKITGRVLALDRALEDTLPYLLGLLGLVEGEEALAQMDPQVKKRRTLEAIKRILLRESLSQPLMVIFEDLHWIDEETQALLNVLAEGIANSRVLMLVNYRPEYTHGWGNRTYYTQLRLDPLGKESAQEMLDALLGRENDRLEVASPRSQAASADRVGQAFQPVMPDDIEALKYLIIQKTEGNPFFMEEMVQALFEQGALARNGSVALAKPLNEIRVPATVQAILASRIDRLPAAERELLQILGVLGREFGLGLIRRVAGKSDDALERMLSGLQLGEFIYEQPAVGDIEYTFKHALTQEVAYNSMLTERRRRLHERAAQVIEALHAESLEDHLPELARHYDRGGNVRKAVEYMERAGARAAQQTAHSEAADYFNRALELLKQLPDDPARGRQEINLQMVLSRSVFFLNPVAPERERALIRAQALSEQLGDSACLMEALVALGVLRLVRREYGSAQELAQRALALAEPATAQATVVGAHYVLGSTLSYLGQFAAARGHLELAVMPLSAEALYAPAAAVRLIPTLVLLGFPEAALTKSHEFLEAMRRISDPASMVRSLLSDSLLHCLLRASHTAVERAQLALSIAIEHGMSFHSTLAAFQRGWAMALDRPGQEGAAQMARTAPAFEGNAMISLFYAALAESYRKTGCLEEGFAAVAKGLSEGQRSGYRFFEAELHRIRGELTMMQEAHEEAERCFRTATEIARAQAAKWWELRATTSLARLFNRQGKPAEARAMLAEIYNWFTEGFEFADLKDARALLDELNG